VDGSTTSFQDSGLTPSTTYSYTVDAFDAAGNHSAPSSAASDTTFAPVGATTTFNPAADAYVDSTSTATQGTNYGTKPTLRVDASPDTLSYLRFNVTGLSGAVSSAVLRVYATSNHTVGYDVFSVPNNTWTETGITYNNKPATAALKTGSSGRITGAPVYTEVDVSSLVSGNGPVSLALKTTSSTALAFASREVANPPQLVVATSGGTDAQKPSKPTGLTATAVSTSEIDLAWNPSSDNVGVTGYTIYRDNNPVGTVDGSTTSFQDTGLSPATSYSYTVDAFDAAANHSLPSDPASATTFTSTGGTTTFNPVADAYVVGTSPTTNFGTATSLRVDASPDTASYLRFSVAGLTGPVASATLRIYATSNQSPGYDVFGVADNTWTESGINYNNRPALAAAKTGSSGKVAGAPVYTTVDVTPLVSGNGPVSLALTTTSSTALALASRESATKPELVVQTMP
jgi:chitodextrinase